MKKVSKEIKAVSKKAKIQAAALKILETPSGQTQVFFNRSTA